LNKINFHRWQHLFRRTQTVDSMHRLYALSHESNREAYQESKCPRIQKLMSKAFCFSSRVKFAIFCNQSHSPWKGSNINRSHRRPNMKNGRQPTKTASKNQKPSCFLTLFPNQRISICLHDPPSLETLDRIEKNNTKKWFRLCRIRLCFSCFWVVASRFLLVLLWRSSFRVPCALFGQCL